MLVVWRADRQVGKVRMLLRMLDREPFGRVAVMHNTAQIAVQIAPQIATHADTLSAQGQLWRGDETQAGHDRLSNRDHE